MNPVVRSFGLRIAWLVCAALIAFGTAGIVAAMEHAPGTPSRAELTWGADRQIAPGLAAAADDLRALTANVDGLSTLGTNALAAVNGGDAPAIQAAIVDGKTLIATIDAETAALRSKLGGLPGVGPGAQGRLGGLALEEIRTLSQALDSTAGLGASWDRLTVGSLSAVQLQTTLADHDTATAAAAQLGTAGKYAEAVVQLSVSDASIAESRRQRDAMSAAVDTSVLTEWIDRNAAYDTALRQLYSLLDASKGAVTDAVKTAFAGERAAKALLPRDTRALIIVMSDIARGGLNQAVISIEDAKGRLSASLDAFTLTQIRGGAGQPNPGSSPAPDASIAP